MTGALVLGPDKTGRTLAIDDGIIVPRAPAGARPIACADGLIEAGAVCAHTHIYSGLAPFGMPAPDPKPETFLQILERVWWRLDRALDEKSLRASAQLYIARALLAGTTTLVDHHESPNFIEGSMAILAEACEAFGIRALLCYGATERNGGLEEARRGLAETARVPTSPILRGLVGLHASFTCSDETIRAAGALARDLGVGVHVHVAEAASDVEDAKARGFAGPLERLIDLGALPEGSLVAHGVFLSPEQIRRVEDLGGWMLHNPRSNEGNGVGYAGSLSASRHVALGVDGWNPDMAEEAAALARLAAAHGDKGTAGRLERGRDLIATQFGFSAVGLEPGAAADIVVRDAAARIRHVIVAGRPVVENGHLVAGDLGPIEEVARQEAAHLWQRMAAL